MANSKLTFGYWGLRGLAQPSRFLAAYLGIELNEKRYTSMEEWGAEKFNLGLDFPNIPYLIDGDFKITESRAVIKRLAQGSAAYPSTENALAICDMVESVLYDVWFGLIRYCNGGEATLKGYLDDQVPKKMAYLSTFLEKKKHVLGDQISYVDFILYEMLYHYTQYQADYLDKYPVLVAYKKAFEEIPAIAKYIASSAYIKGPCINPMAKIPF